MKPSISQNNSQTWRPLGLFNLYRLTLALALLVFFHTDMLIGKLGELHPEAYLATSLTFFVSSLLFIFMQQKRSPSFNRQVVLGNSSDIILITLLMHFSGGLSSALGMLIIINIVATGTFLRPRQSFFFAALASMAILGEQTYSYYHHISDAASYTTAGILGIVFFASSMLASILVERAREYEAMASQREADLLHLEKLNEHIIQNMRTGILVVDNQGQIKLANQAAERLLGQNSLQRATQLEKIFPILDKRFFEWLAQPQMQQTPIQQSQGLPDIQPGFRQLYDADGQPGDTLIFLEDATQLNQRFQQIKLASLGRLTASIAHEIRNPLSAINHAAQLLSEADLDEGDQKLTSIITMQVQRLDTVIKNVLQLSRNESSSPEAINIRQWCENFKEEFCTRNQLQAEQFNINIPADNLQVLFDPSHLHQVFDNLCGNAISHNDREKSDVKITIDGGFDWDSDQIYIDVKDNGPGIDEETIQQIFDPFFTTSSKGTGLGLYISKEMIESNRARIRYIHVDDQAGGSCFRIYFLKA